MTIDWEQAPLKDLIAHILDTHHAYLHVELPRLRAEVERLRTATEYPHQLDAISELLESLDTDLVPHLMKEEQVLFPCILHQDSTDIPQSYPFGSFRVPIEAMEEDHLSIDVILHAMRDVTDNYRTEGPTDEPYLAFLIALDGLDRDLVTHIHLENDILHPRTLDLERDRERG